MATWKMRFFTIFFVTNVWLYIFFYDQNTDGIACIHVDIKRIMTICSLEQSVLMFNRLNYCGPAGIMFFLYLFVNEGQDGVFNPLTCNLPSLLVKYQTV